MCLIITGKAQKIRETLLDTEGLLGDIFKSNSNGIGVMYVNAKGLKIVKALPKTYEQAEKFIRRIPSDERELAIHFRYTTHGANDHENCHPYPIIPRTLALMHNGVLSTGNDADKSKSDTWHFIEDFLKRPAELAPDIFFDKSFLGLVQESIGHNNRFVFMHADGRMAILNKSEGVEHDGMWFSNTYAWKPTILIPDYYKSRYGSYSYNYGSFGGTWDGKGGYTPRRSPYSHLYEEWEQEFDYPASTPNVQPKSNVIGFSAPNTKAHDANYRDDDDNFDKQYEEAVRNANEEWQREQEEAEVPEVPAEVEAAVRAQDGEQKVEPPTPTEMVQCIVDSDVDTMELWLNDVPYTTLALLFRVFQPRASMSCPRKDLSTPEQVVYDEVMGEHITDLARGCERSYSLTTMLAEVVCYYIDWRLRAAPIPMGTTVQQKIEPAAQGEEPELSGGAVEQTTPNAAPDGHLDSPTATSLL